MKFSKELIFEENWKRILIEVYAAGSFAPILLRKSDDIFRKIVTDCV